MENIEKENFIYFKLIIANNKHYKYEDKYLNVYSFFWQF